MSVALEVSSTVDVRCPNFSMRLCFRTWGQLMLGVVSLKTRPFWDSTMETNVHTFLKNNKLFARTIYIRLLIKIYHKSLVWTKKKWKKSIFQFLPLNALYISVSWISEVVLVWSGTLNCQQKYLYNSHAVNNPLNMLFCCYKKYIV